MATLKYQGTESVQAALRELTLTASRETIGPAMYQGAAKIAEELRSRVEMLHEDSGHGTPENPLYGVGRVQKEALLDSLGISPIREERQGVYKMYIGFAGYNKVKTRRWPNGQPNQMVARAVNKGTSFMQKQPFLRAAVSAGQQRCEAAMTEVFERKINDVKKELI